MTDRNAINIYVKPELYRAWREARAITPPVDHLNLSELVAKAIEQWLAKVSK